MNKNVHYTTQFKKDFKQCIKRGYNMQQIKSVMKLLESGRYYVRRIRTIQYKSNTIIALYYYIINVIIALYYYIRYVKKAL